MNLLSYILSAVFIFVPATAWAEQEEVTLLFAGDISFSGPVKYHVDRNHHSYNDLFNEVAPFIREADISVANLESPFVSKDVYRYKYKGRKMVILDSSPEAVSALSTAGFDVITLANNHLNDFGSQGANFTMQVLKEADMKYFGVSYGEFNSSQEPLIIDSKGLRIAFLGYCDEFLIHGKHNCTEIRSSFSSGPAVYQDAIATRDIENLKAANVDIIVVFMHWGKELLFEPLPYQLHITKHLVSLGVQVITGSHPHVLQPHCIYDNTVIAYSLGNFLFPPARLLGGNDPNLYGRLGMKPEESMIKVYERYVLGNKIFRDLTFSQLLQVKVTRNGVKGAKYLPLEIAFDSKAKRLHPKPIRKAKWITFCGQDDVQCQKCNF